VLQTLKVEIKLKGHSLSALASFNIKEPANNNAGHSHIIMTESGMRFLEMEGFLKTPITLVTSTK
jgi:hypothetical protein